MIKLLGIPYDANSSFVKGPAKAPPVIRLMHKQGSSNPSTENGKYVEFGDNLYDYGDMCFSSEKPEQIHQEIVAKVSDLIADGSKLLSLGGDHYITFPVVEAFSRHFDSIHLLHFDAHSDLYEDFEDNYYSHASPFARIMEHRWISSLTQVGLRTLCDHQRNQINKYQIRVVEMGAFTKDFLNELEGPLYISLDLDVLDPAFAPGVSHHEPGGLSVREIIACLHEIKAPVIGADIVEYNPDRDLNQMTAMVAYKLLKELWSLM